MNQAPSATLKLEHYQKLVEISKELVTNHDLASLLSHIVQAACELSDAGAASLLLYNENTKELYFQSATGLDESILRGMIVPVDGSLAGWVVKSDAMVNIPDVHKDERFFSKVEQASQVPTKSLAGLPLKLNGKVIGVLEVINKKETHFSGYDMEVLSVLATQAALAIENTRLFQQSDQIAELVHELRTPLSSISTAAYLLQMEKIPDGQRISLARTIYNETQRLSDLASTFLDMARLESGRVSFIPSTFNLIEVIHEVILIFQSRLDHLSIQVQLNVQDSFPSILADREKIKQVLINLLSNAIKYNREGGQIEIAASFDTDSISVSVKDNGLGIQPEVLGHLFEKFYRAKPMENLIAGTGLGLSICKSIIESHHGEISVESIFGEGSTFRFSLPRREN